MTNPMLPMDEKRRIGAHSALTQPSLFLPVLAEAIQDELVFYSHDLTGNATFISQSAERVFNLKPDQWLNRPFWDFITNNRCNDAGQFWKASNEATATSGECEMCDREGNRLTLKYWQVPIIFEGVCIGRSGIVLRLTESSTESPQGSELGAKEMKDLLARVGLLTDVEVNVIEMVVDGYMNKQMASILKVAVRTIESRRARAMSKLETKTLSELVQTWVKVRRIRASSIYEPIAAKV